MALTFRELPDRYVVCRLAPDAPIPTWIPAGPLVSITRTQDELSIVCREPDPLPDVKCEADWMALKLKAISVHPDWRPVVFPRAVGRKQIPIFAVSQLRPTMSSSSAKPSKQQ
jgi:hypothetical protein